MVRVSSTSGTPASPPDPCSRCSGHHRLVPTTSRLFWAQRFTNAAGSRLSVLTLSRLRLSGCSSAGSDTAAEEPQQNVAVFAHGSQRIKWVWYPPRIAGLTFGKTNLLGLARAMQDTLPCLPVFPVSARIYLSLCSPLCDGLIYSGIRSKGVIK